MPPVDQFMHYTKHLFLLPIRLDKPVPLFTEDPSKSSILPICLPWSKSDPARSIKEGDLSLVAGWGASSNDIRITLKRFQKFGAYHPQLSKAKLPIANCQLPVDKTLQLCAGGAEGIKTSINHFLTH